MTQCRIIDAGPEQTVRGYDQRAKRQTLFGVIDAGPEQAEGGYDQRAKRQKG